MTPFIDKNEDSASLSVSLPKNPEPPTRWGAHLKTKVVQNWYTKIFLRNKDPDVKRFTDVLSSVSWLTPEANTRFETFWSRLTSSLILHQSSSHVLQHAFFCKCPKTFAVHQYIRWINRTYFNSTYTPAIMCQVGIRFLETFELSKDATNTCN